MATSESHADENRDEGAVRPEAPIALDHAFVLDEDRRTECTMFPRDRDDVDVVTRWITAKEDSFVDLRATR